MLLGLFLGIFASCGGLFIFFIAILDIVFNKTNAPIYYLPLFVLGTSVLFLGFYYLAKRFGASPPFLRGFAMTSIVAFLLSGSCSSLIALST